MENKVDIQLTEKDKEIIKEHVSKIESPNCYLEIGVHQGGSAIQALEAANDDVELYGVDILNNFRLKDTRFNFINKPSVEAAIEWNKSIGVLFIDGNHDAAGEDFKTWEKFVVSDGYILMHDMAFHSPKVIKDCNIIKMDSRYEVVRIPNETDKNTSSIFIVKKK